MLANISVLCVQNGKNSKPFTVNPLDPTHTTPKLTRIFPYIYPPPPLVATPKHLLVTSIFLFPFPLLASSFFSMSRKRCWISCLSPLPCSIIPDPQLTALPSLHVTPSPHQIPQFQWCTPRHQALVRVSVCMTVVPLSTLVIVATWPSQQFRLWEATRTLTAKKEMISVRGGLLALPRKTAGSDPTCPHMTAGDGHLHLLTTISSTKPRLECVHMTSTISWEWRGIVIRNGVQG